MLVRYISLHKTALLLTVWFHLHVIPDHGISPRAPLTTRLILLVCQYTYVSPFISFICALAFIRHTWLVWARHPFWYVYCPTLMLPPALYPSRSFLRDILVVSSNNTFILYQNI